MFLAKKLNKGSGTPAPTVDAQFNYVTMLLHGDGTNGAQNNTFVDSGPNTFSITRGGNATQGSFGPYGDNWSNFFSYNSTAVNYLTSNSLSLSGNFTIEGYVNWDGVGSNPNMFTLGDSFQSTGIEVYLSGGSWVVYSGNATRITGSAGVVGQWTYIAVTRTGSTVTLYINGVSQGTWTSSATFSGTIKVGAEFYSSTYYSSMSGYISNFRVNNTTAINTVPTAPLTAVSGTIFLTCQSNRFIDNSTNTYSITVNGTPSVQRFNPFGTSTAYSTSVIGGSAYFDGSGDYLQGPTNNSAFQFGMGDFTVEAWVYLTADNTYPSILEIGDHLATTGILFIYWGNSGGNVAAIYSGGFKGSTPVTMNAWNHIAYVRSSFSLKIYVNGVSPAGVTFLNDLSNSNKVTIGVDQNLTAGYYFTGNISNLRVVKGTAVYTSNFTPPTTPLTAISGTSLLMPMTNAAIFDNAMMTDLETVGDAQISTSVKKYGTGSLSFDGTGDWVRSFDNLPIAFGSGDFTVEGWIYLNNVSSTKGIMYGLGNNSFGLRVGQSYLGNVNGLNISRSGIADLEYCAFTFATSTWYHIAVVRSGTTIYFFVNGTQQTTQGSGGSSYNFATPTTGFIIGANNDTNERFNGYIDDFRITKGYARYTANFTAPTAAFFDTGPN